jgi:hypothetical protein
MEAPAFWKAVTVDRSNLMERFVELLRIHEVRFCLIGGQAVNAYAEPLVSLDLDVVVAAEQLDRVRAILGDNFTVEPFPHSLNIAAPGSDLRIQIQLDPRYAPFVDRAVAREVLGVRLPVAAIEDVLTGKIWAAEDTARRPSKRQKDLADIARLLEAYPNLRPSVPASVLEKLV